MPPKKQEKIFDPAKLQKMQEPLTVRIEKLKANSKQPIEIPGRAVVDGVHPTPVVIGREGENPGHETPDVVREAGFEKGFLRIETVGR